SYTHIFARFDSVAVLIFMCRGFFPEGIAHMGTAQIVSYRGSAVRMYHASGKVLRKCFNGSCVGFGSNSGRISTFWYMRPQDVLFFLMAFASVTFAQTPKALSDAERYFGIRNYEEALPLFLQAIEGGVKDPMVHYKTGVCLSNSVQTDKQLEAIPYLEYALNNGAALPASVHYDLGSLYLLNEQLQKAIQAFTRFKELSNKS